MKKKVIVAGHICLDITPVFPDGKVKSVEQVLSPGKLIQMGNADVHTGGAVANTGLLSYGKSRRGCIWRHDFKHTGRI